MHLFSRRTSLRSHQSEDVSEARFSFTSAAGASQTSAETDARCSLYQFISKREINYVHAMSWSVKAWSYQKGSLSLRRHAHGPLAKRLMHIAHLSGNTSGVSKSSSDWLNYTGFLGDVCVAFLNIPPGNKNAVTPNPLTKEESCRVYNCDDERLSGSTKCLIFKSMWNI